MPKRTWHDAIPTEDPKEHWRLAHIDAIQQSHLYAIKKCYSCEIWGKPCSVLNGMISYEGGYQHRCLECLQRKIACHIGDATSTTPAFTPNQSGNHINLNPYVQTSPPSGPGPHPYPNDYTPLYLQDNPFFPDADIAKRLRQMQKDLADMTEEKAKAERAGQEANLAKQRAESRENQANRLRQTAEGSLVLVAKHKNEAERKLSLALDEKRAAEAARAEAGRKLAIIREAHDMEREMYLEKIKGLMSVEVKRQ